MLHLYASQEEHFDTHLEQNFCLYLAYKLLLFQTATMQAVPSSLLGRGLLLHRLWPWTKDSFKRRQGLLEPLFQRHWLPCTQTYDIAFIGARLTMLKMHCESSWQRQILLQLPLNTTFCVAINLLRPECDLCTTTSLETQQNATEA